MITPPEDDNLWTISVEDKELFVSVIEKNTVRLHLSPFFDIEGMTMPNRWWRFWQWALLGWTWEKIGDD